MKPKTSSKKEKVSTLTRKILTLLSRKKDKKTVVYLAKHFKVSRQTIYNHLKTLKKIGFITKKLNPRNPGKNYLTKTPSAPEEENVKDIHNYILYSKIVSFPGKWKNRKEVFGTSTNFNSWKLSTNNEITIFSIDTVDYRISQRKLAIKLSGLKANSVDAAKKGLFSLLSEIKVHFQARFDLILSGNWFVESQHIASQRDYIAEIVVAAKDRGWITPEGQYILEIRDRKGAKRAIVDTSELEEFEAVHPNHAGDDMDIHSKHLQALRRWKPNAVQKYFRDAFENDPPTLSYQRKLLRQVSDRVEAQDVLLEKLEEVAKKSVEAATRAAEASFILSEKIVEAFKR